MKKPKPHARPKRDVSRAEWALIIVATVYFSAHLCHWLLEIYLMQGGLP